jgi:hypothetical protein
MEEKPPGRQQREVRSGDLNQIQKSPGAQMILRSIKKLSCFPEIPPRAV